MNHTLAAARVAEMLFGGFLTPTSLPSTDDSRRLTGHVAQPLVRQRARFATARLVLSRVQGYR